MKSTLYLKFIILYIIFGFLSIFATATLSPQLIKDRLEESTSQTLFKEAHLISNEYLPSYFAGNMTSWSVHSQLTAMKLYLGSSLWFVDNIAPETIEDFDPAEIGNNQYIIGDYHGYFDEDVITVMAPVTQGFATKGYLLIHSPVSSIDKTCQDLMFTIYITLLVIYILSFIFLLGFHFFIFRPLAQVTEAAKQYALGNLDYEIPVYKLYVLTVKGHGGLPEKVCRQCVSRLSFSSDLHKGICGSNDRWHHSARTARKILEDHSI